MHEDIRLKIAIVGTGIAGLSAAWLLNRRHDITVYEQADRVGGHSNTVQVAAAGRTIPVDTGFIVYNRRTYPNLTALFEALAVPTRRSTMSFSVSLDDGDLEYTGTGLSGIFAQRRNLLRPRCWSMLADLLRFYRNAVRDLERLEEGTTLGDYLAAGGYGAAFRDDHLLPMASAIWCSSPAEILAYPAAAFIRFNHNHGLLDASQRPVWETVVGGSTNYVQRLVRPFADRIRLDTAVVGVRRLRDGIVVTDSKGWSERYDHVVMASHADQTLAALTDPTARETALLGAFRHTRNHAVLHSDATLMPKRRGVWSSWNYVGARGTPGEGACVTYWMNRLQSIAGSEQLFLTLNPPRPPRAGTLHHSEIYDHPIFDARAMAAQRELWSLQGRRNTWFCGAYFGAGFHEDGLQAGLAVAEQIGGVKRPWTVPNESGRIFIGAASELERAE